MMFAGIDGGRADGAEDSELASSLLLVRASAIRMARLQLAIERRDRGVALQAIDDLIDIDTQMARMLDAMSPSALSPLQRDVEEQRAALLREKFGLAAGLVRRSAEAGPPSWIEPERVGEPDAVEAEPCDDAVWATEADARPGRSVTLLVAAVLMVLLAAAAMAALLIGPADLLGRSITQGGIG